jgi:hypothetical protein
MVFSGLTFDRPAKAQVSQWESHFNARMMIILFHTQEFGQGRPMILGDSNTEGFGWSEIGGCRYINAGMGGATIRDLATRAEALAVNSRPAVVHIMLGTNNVPVPLTDSSWGTMRSDLTRIVAAFQAVGAKVVMWPVPPVTAPFADHAAQDRRNHINAIVQDVASATGSYWEWWWPEQIGPGGVAIAGALQADGVHFTSQTQQSRYYRIDTWRKYIQQQTGVSGC